MEGQRKSNLDYVNESLDFMDAADRLSPRDPRLSGRQTIRAAGNFVLERFEESAEWARRASRSQNPRYWVDAMLVAALQKLGDTAGVEAAKRTLFERRPDYRLPKESPLGPEYLEALREAGLPE